MPWDMVTPNKQYNPLAVAARCVKLTATCNVATLHSFRLGIQVTRTSLPLHARELTYGAYNRTTHSVALLVLTVVLHAQDCYLLA